MNAPTLPLEHLCLSGSPVCSHVNPCLSCAAEVEQRVLPAASTAAGLNGALLALVHLYAGVLYQVHQRHPELGVEPANLALSQVGVPLSTVFATPEQQGQAFIGEYRAAFGRLVNALTNDPTLAPRVVRTTLSGAAPPQEQVSLQPPATGQQEQAGLQPPVGQLEPPAPPPPAPPVSSAPAGPLEAGLPAAPAVAAPASTSAYEQFLQKRKAAPATPAIQAEDIAAAAVAVDASDPAVRASVDPVPEVIVVLPNGVAGGPS